MGCKLKNNKTDIMPIKDDILQNIYNKFEFANKIDTPLLHRSCALAIGDISSIKLYSTDPYFYKKNYIQW